MPEYDVPTPAEVPLAKPRRAAGTARARRGNGRSVLEDVARRAGVSTATVSRVYNDPGKVSAAVRTRVEEAALALNWIPHAAGRALASTRTHIAGIIIPTLDDQVFASQVSGMQAAFAEHGITLFLGCSNYAPAQALTQVQAMLARGVEAMALVGEAHPPEVFDALRRYHVPYVVTYAYRDDSPHVCVGFDNAAAYAQIVDRLVALGHRRFGAVFQPADDNDRVQGRLRGLHEALRRHGLSIPPEHQREGPSTLAFGREGLRAIMGLDRSPMTTSDGANAMAARDVGGAADEASPPTSAAAGLCPTAIVCGNDMLALGVLREAAAQGIAVPEALSVTGFDDLALAAESHPPLTTMRVDTHRIGRLAAERLLSMMQRAATTPIPAPALADTGDAAAPPDRRTAPTPENRFEPEWLERGSTASPSPD